MPELRQLYFLIHGLCYSGMAYRQPARADEAGFRYFFDLEKQRIERWRSSIRDLPADAGLVIVPWLHGGCGPAAEFEAFATDALGGRCFILDATMPRENAFWREDCPEFVSGVFQEFRDACLGQGYDWNKEELSTALHSRACALRLLDRMQSRGYEFDPAAVQAMAWGASFEGCVSKYSGNLRRLLGLGHAMEIEFEMTVPDAAFLLRATRCERVPLGPNICLFLFCFEGPPAALFLRTSVSLADRLLWAKMPPTPHPVKVMSKQEGRLWPQPAEDKTPVRDIGHHEPPQELVTAVEGRLRLPVSSGMVYRLAKAPFYIFAGPDMSLEEFRAWLLAAAFEG